MSFKYLSESVKKTEQLGKILAKNLKPGDIVCLFGELGSGKTVLAKGIAQGLRIKKKDIHSPTFTLMNIYPGPKVPIYHFDLYRIKKPKEIEAIGYEDFFYGEGISVVEWADRLGPLLPKAYLSIKLEHKSEDERFITVMGKTKYFKELVEKIKV
ncbi:MAG: tRNA (adenosine(37)-N6)-threonylcarbamoyltransferase complex ATPase subunit type 1 TsaE [Candidatus Omnitrophica bacterium]|nr:tRNA (adenosine(37)-N6)-threonylcarbamoyltransferase complex ATPase subunit type 1 TsaE [Candidatus Omnitrophota bacterium]